MTESPIAVSVERLVKSFYLPDEEPPSLRSRLLHPVRRERRRELRVLDGISFDVHKGEMFGIVGGNGSGKSTLLRLIASIYDPDGGRIGVDGRVAPFLELGVGFNPDLSAHQNVILNGVMLGLPPKLLERRLGEILEFAEVSDFADVPLKYFSSGMRVRLAFAVMVQADPDVLLIDEILAVGDAEFRERCMATFDRMRDAGKTILYVSHVMPTIEQCDRALLLHHGRIEKAGDTREVIQRYMELSLASQGQAGTGTAAGRGPTSGLVASRQDRARILELWLDDGNGRRSPSVAEGDRIELRARIEVSKRIRSPGLRLELRNERGAKLFAPPDAEVAETVFDAGDVIEARASILNPLPPGRYRLSCLLVNQGPRGLGAASEVRTFEFDVAGHRRPGGGLVALEHEVSFERERSPELTAG